MTPPARPVGRAAVIATFGNPIEYVNTKPIWESSALAYVDLPSSLIYAVDTTVLITRIRAHKLIVDHLAQTLMACLAAGVPADRMKYGGCYCWRAERGSATALSLHTWGIAIDLDPVENPRGKPWVDDGIMLHPTIIQTFAANGWHWGNGFNVPDPQHHQFATGT